MKQLNEKTMSIVQIETKQGVENIEAILNVKGIDGVLIGPCDLAISLGRPDDLMHEEELSMIQKVADACLKRALGFGIIGGRAMQEYFKKESSLLVSAIDTALMREGLIQAVREYEQLERT